MKRILFKNLVLPIAIIPSICLFASCQSNSKDGNSITCNVKEKHTKDDAVFDFKWSGALPDKNIFSNITLIQDKDITPEQQLRITNNPMIDENGEFFLNISLISSTVEDRVVAPFDLKFEWVDNGQAKEQTIDSLTFYYDIDIVPPKGLTQTFEHSQVGDNHIYDVKFGLFKLCDSSIAAETLIPSVRQSIGEEKIGDLYASIMVNKPYFYVGIHVETTYLITEGSYTFEISISSNGKLLFVGDMFMGVIDNE